MRRTATILLCLFLPLQAAAEQVPQSQAQISLSFAPLVKEAAPAVVNIYASRVVQDRSPFAGDPLFGGLFRDFQARPRVQNSLGSGVILSEDGYVVSNYHVVGQATDIRVVLNDRREFEADVLLADEEADLAILQLKNAKDMPFLDLRNSETVEVGELVLAIGNPFGVGQTVSSGIVSGLARTGTATGNGRGYFIQTDAPINPGNSGGALIDVSGRLIGVNTSILTRSGGSNGIGFAIPSALVQQFVQQARDGQTGFQRPWAGMTGQPVDADLSDSLGLGVPGGVVVVQMHPASPFAASGLTPGDVVLAVDGEPVNTPPEMIYRMSVRGIGAEAEITYVRDGKQEIAKVAMIPPPDEPPAERTVIDQDGVLPGLSLARINPAVSAEMGLSTQAKGIVVLDPGPFGARAGLQQGDILNAIDGVDIVSPTEVDALLRDAAPRIQIDAQRGNRRLVLRFRI
ncbi:trypsin-like peptidase domain-containing protein [Primorskyibacter sp. 2E233]|uniref:trypsin-like peptidase domain-containing protein n=1 Tax=Primorskyibacter sp. 2E233 TaxID=3413431 RepID=UPI003BF22619